ncbi:MSHA biogenesis protein MshI [Vibrio mimicus]|uniref:MSHA biogenesis protein MshI n=1 Tax=Vibrio mimicus TaxID=674 RepID=UPI002F95469E
MKKPSWIEKLIAPKAASRQLYVVVQPESLYFTADDVSPIPPQPSNQQNWQSVLVQTLQKHAIQDVQVHLVLHSQLYQAYQIEQPSVPREEWSAALPFLLKDMLSEKVTEVVADAHPLPGSGKVQAYVISKRTILELQRTLSAAGLTLGRVMPDLAVWGLTGGELSHFLLLHRSLGGSFKLDAFVEHQCSFQRTLRGITAPVTDNAASVLQLDSLALELQRSIDYLSAQLKGGSLQQLKVCCDGEDQQALIDGLNERLSVRASGLNGEATSCGEQLARYARHVPQETINFYQDHLKPKREKFTLANLLLAWLALSAVLLLGYAGAGYQNYVVNHQWQELQTQNQSLTEQATDLRQQVASHLPSAGKVVAIERLKKEIAAKQQALQAIGQFDAAQQVGYSGVLNSLAQLARNDISLSSIALDAVQLNVQGLARDPAAIPNWINQFKQELHLVGRTFEQLKIGRNEQDMITFELNTQRGELK